MIHLPRSLNAWNTPDFKDVLKQEIEQLDTGQLPLQQGLTTSSHALDDKLSVMVISVADAPGFIHARAGIFFRGIVAGCSCADDPMPIEPQSEYCEVQLAIDKTTAEALILHQAD